MKGYVRAKALLDKYSLTRYALQQLENKGLIRAYKMYDNGQKMYKEEEVKALIDKQLQ